MNEILSTDLSVELAMDSERLWILAVGGLALAGFTVRRVRRQLGREAVSHWMGAGILTARLLVWGALVTLLAGIGVRETESVRTTPRIHLVRDVSESVSAEEGKQLADWERRLITTLDAHGVRVRQSSSTDLGMSSGLDQDVPSAEPILWLSDARGLPPLQESRARVHGVFSEAKLPRVILDAPLGPHFVLRDEPVTFSFRLIVEGLAGASLRVTWETEDRTLSTRVVAIDGARFDRRVELESQALTIGLRRFRVRIDGPSGRLAELSGRFECLDEPLRVLVLDERPTWTYRFLTASLVRDPRLDARTWLIDADSEAVREASEGSPPLQRFPTGAELAGFDVVLLGDVDPERLPAGAAEDLRRFVEEGAGALVWMPGPRITTRAWTGSPLFELLPFELPADDSWKASAFHPRLSIAGRRRDWLRLDPDPARSVAIWEGRGDSPHTIPPAFTGHAASGAPRPGARVLAEHPQSGDPLLLEQSFGRGRVLWIGIDELWRWRFAIEDRYFSRFFGQAIRAVSDLDRLVTLRHGRLVARPAAVNRGESVSVRWLGPHEAPESVEWIDPQGNRHTRAMEGGEVHLACPDSGALEARPTSGRGHGTSWRVSPASGEATAERLIEEWESWLAASGGARWKPSDLEREVLALTRESEIRTVDRGLRRLVSEQLVLIALMALLGLEWTLRKIAHLE